MEYIALAAGLAIGHEIHTADPTGTDCQSVLNVLERSDYNLCTANGTHRTLLQYTNAKLQQGQPMPEYVEGQPERKVPNRQKWTRHQCGNHQADRAAADDWNDFPSAEVVRISAKELIGDLLAPGTWYISDADTRPDDRTNLLESATLRNYGEYLSHRDTHRHEPPKWAGNTIRLAAKSYNIRITTPVDIRSTFGRLIYEKRKKRIDMTCYKEEDALCVICGYLNDPLDDLKANCRFIKQERHLRVEALRDIQLNDELLLAYGEDYWLNNDFSVDILQQAMVAYGTGSTRAAWHAKIQKNSAMLTVPSVDARDGMMVTSPMTTEVVPHVAEPWGISNSGLLQQCEEKKRKHQQIRDEEANVRRTAQAIQNARTGNCSSTYAYLQATGGEAQAVEQRSSSKVCSGSIGAYEILHDQQLH
eukprot:gene42123-biopygen5647